MQKIQFESAEIKKQNLKKFITLIIFKKKQLFIQIFQFQQLITLQLKTIIKIEDYDREVRVRKPMDAEHESKILKLKNDKTKRELHVQELDYKIHILEQENQSLRNQMDQMKTDYKRLNQVFEEKYRHEIERLHLENQDYENSNKQWSSRFKDLNAKCDDLVHDKQDLEEENRKLNDKILKIQVLLHEQPIKNQMKYEGSNKNY